MQVAHSIRDRKHVGNKQVNRARTELVRLINLAHVLVCVSADGQNKAFAKRGFELCAPGRRQPVLLVCIARMHLTCRFRTLFDMQPR